MSNMIKAGLVAGVRRKIRIKKAPHDPADFMPPWPCQQLHGGRAPYIYQGVDEYGRCRHPECNPANDDRVRVIEAPEGGES